MADEARFVWDMRWAVYQAQELLGARSVEEFKADIKTLRAVERCVEILEEAARRYRRSQEGSDGEGQGEAFHAAEMSPEELYHIVKEGLPRLSKHLDERLAEAGVEWDASWGARWPEGPFSAHPEEFKALWESLVAEAGASQLTLEQKAELERCLEAYERDGDPGRPMEEVLESLKAMLRRH